MNNISPERLQTSLNVVGGAASTARSTRSRSRSPTAPGSRSRAPRSPLTAVTVFATWARAAPAASQRSFVPHATCDFRVANGSAVGIADDVAVAGDRALAMKLTGAPGDVGGTVPATLALAVGPPATFGAFMPGVGRTTSRRRRRT